MNIIQESEIRDVVAFDRYFHFDGHDGWGYSFDCDEHGNVTGLGDQAQANYEACLTGVDREGRVVIDTGIRRREYTVRLPAIGRCECGGEVVLDGFTNTCSDCQRDYDTGGSLLAPREQWGEETGERYSDIARIR